jgi:hypothetical protein
MAAAYGASVSPADAPSASAGRWEASGGGGGVVVTYRLYSQLQLPWIPSDDQTLTARPRSESSKVEKWAIAMVLSIQLLQQLPLR